MLGKESVASCYAKKICLNEFAPVPWVLQHCTRNFAQSNWAKDNRKTPWSVLLCGQYAEASYPPRMLTQGGIPANVVLVQRLDFRKALYTGVGDRIRSLTG